MSGRSSWIGVVRIGESRGIGVVFGDGDGSEGGERGGRSIVVSLPFLVTRGSVLRQVAVRLGGLDERLGKLGGSFLLIIPHRPAESTHGRVLGQRGRYFAIYGRL
jgi:hypothetical protein